MPYYGKYPGYFDLWLKTAGANRTIDFYIITDIKDHLDYPPNVHVVDVCFNDLKQHIRNLFDFEIRLKTPYKLCDYKPAYGLIFQDLINKYDCWGYCDPDVIWGDIRTFVTDEILNSNEKIYSRGHLTIYKNNDFNRHAFKDMNHPEVYNFREAYATDRPCYFDEDWGVAYMYQRNKIPCYDKIDFADIHYKHFHFETVDMNVTDNFNLFFWRDGKLFGYKLQNDLLTKKEIVYLHLQKRPMTNNVEKDAGSFAVIPNRFIPVHEEITKEFVAKNCRKKFINPDYIKIRLKIRWDWMITGGIKQKYIRFFKKRRHADDGNP